MGSDPWGVSRELHEMNFQRTPAKLARPRPHAEHRPYQLHTQQHWSLLPCGLSNLRVSDATTHPTPKLNSMAAALCNPTGHEGRHDEQKERRSKANHTILHASERGEA